MALEKLVPLRPIMLDRVYLEGEPFTAANERDHKRHLESKRFRIATKEDLEAWANRLKADPILAELADRQAPKPAAEDVKADSGGKGGKGKAEADAKAKAEADAKAKAEAEEKEKAEAEAKAKVEADSKPGASTGSVGIG